MDSTPPLAIVRTYNDAVGCAALAGDVAARRGVLAIDIWGQCFGGGLQVDQLSFVVLHIWRVVK